jgi:hypothetical protein
VKSAYKIRTVRQSVFSEFAVYQLPNKRAGETMTTQIIQNKRYPDCERTERMQDLLLVSSFGLWAALLGLSPVLAFRLLMGS